MWIPSVRYMFIDWFNCWTLIMFKIQRTMHARYLATCSDQMVNKCWSRKLNLGTLSAQQSLRMLPQPVLSHRNISINENHHYHKHNTKSNFSRHIKERDQTNWNKRAQHLGTLMDHLNLEDFSAIQWLTSVSKRDTKVGLLLSCYPYLMFTFVKTQSCWNVSLLCNQV